MAATDTRKPVTRGLRCKPIRSRLSRATCGLLGLAPTVVAAAEPWDIDLGLMNYIEQDRNTGLEFLLDASRELQNGDRVAFGVEIDTLTGATPNGATPSNVPQTFTQSSGERSYTVDANELPADDTHMDTRLAIAGEYLNRYALDKSVSYGGHLSMEFDYQSFGAGNEWQWELLGGNTTVDVGIYGEYNRVHPVGNVPDELALMTPTETPQNRREASISKRVAELGFGLTQVIDTRSLFQWRYTESHFTGYLNDPYKLVSIVDDENSASLGETLEYRFENRPGTRDIQTLYLAYKRDLRSGILDLSLRLSEDDWDISATTLDLRYRHRLSGKSYLQPRLRLYHQSEAEFFRHSLGSSEGLPQYVSADLRLAEFDAVTLGLKYGFPGSEGGEHSIAVDYYTQIGDGSPDEAIGLQQDQDLFPTLHTLIVRYLFSTRW